MQHHILYLAGLSRPHGTDARTLSRYDARARVERANGVHDAFTALGRGLAAAVRATVRRIRRRHLARATIRRLEALDDRMLEDIGVHRSGIKAIAWAAAERTTSRADAAAAAAGSGQAQAQEQAGPRERADAPRRAA